MQNSGSEQNLYIESEEEIEEQDGCNSDSSDASSIHNRPGSYNTFWPQSYRQSMDMYTSVQSPNIGFLGTPSLSKVNGSFLTRRHTPEVIKPLLPAAAADHEQQRRSFHPLLPPRPTRRSSYVKESGIEQATSYEAPLPRQCSYGQAVLNVAVGIGDAIDISIGL